MKRQKVIRYEGKDGSEYELVEDLTTGEANTAIGNMLYRTQLQHLTTQELVIWLYKPTLQERNILLLDMVH